MLEKKEYQLLDCLEGDIDVLESFVDGYSGHHYICDVISELADSSIEIYTGQLWENAPLIQEYIEEAIFQGLVDIRSELDLIKVFQAGEYQYYTQLLYDNLQELIYNYGIEYANNEIENNQEMLDNINNNDSWQELEERIEEELSGLDNNDTFEAIEEVIDDILCDYEKVN